MDQQGKSSLRETLGFADEVKEAFYFLTDLSLRQIEEGATFLRFEGNHGFVNIYHGRQSYEIGVEIGTNDGDSEIKFSLQELMRLSDGKMADGFRLPVVTKKELMRKYVQQMAQLFRDYGGRFFSADKSLWVDLGKTRAEWSERYSLETKLVHIRPKAELAFKEKKYDLVIELLGKFEKILNDSEMRKLNYAKDHK